MSIIDPTTRPGIIGPDPDPDFDVLYPKDETDVENMIRYIRNATEPGTVTNGMVAYVMSSLLNRIDNVEAPDIDTSAIEALITAEETARIAADNALDNKIGTEKAIRAQQCGELNTRIDNEQEAREEMIEEKLAPVIGRVTSLETSTTAMHEELLNAEEVLGSVDRRSAQNKIKIEGLTENVTQLEESIDLIRNAGGAPSGIATLDKEGKLKEAQCPEAVIQFGAYYQYINTQQALANLNIAEELTGEIPNGSQLVYLYCTIGESRFILNTTPQVPLTDAILYASWPGSDAINTLRKSALYICNNEIYIPNKSGNKLVKLIADNAQDYSQEIESLTTQIEEQTAACEERFAQMSQVAEELAASLTEQMEGTSLLTLNGKIHQVQENLNLANSHIQGAVDDLRELLLDETALVAAVDFTLNAQEGELFCLDRRPMLGESYSYFRYTPPELIFVPTAGSTTGISINKWVATAIGNNNVGRPHGEIVFSSKMSSSNSVLVRLSFLSYDESTKLIRFHPIYDGHWQTWVDPFMDVRNGSTGYKFIFKPRVVDMDMLQVLCNAKGWDFDATASKEDTSALGFTNVPFDFETIVPFRIGELFTAAQFVRFQSSSTSSPLTVMAELGDTVRKYENPAAPDRKLYYNWSTAGKYHIRLKIDISQYSETTIKIKGQWESC